MSLALGRNVRAVLRRPLHARDAEQRPGRRRTAPGPTTSVCERERRPPANQADGAARTPTMGAIGTPDVRRLIRNVSCDMKLHSVLLGGAIPTKSCVCPQVFHGSMRLAGCGREAATVRGMKPSRQCSKPGSLKLGER
jgi:hypothetical protein